MRIEKDKNTIGQYVAWQKVDGAIVLALGKSHGEALDGLFKKLEWNGVGADVPVRGFCYNVDGLCEDDHCRCWKDIPALVRSVKESREMQKSVGLDVRIDRDRVVKLRVIPFDAEEEIDCYCNDNECPGYGVEGEVGGHIEACTCDVCHRYFSKLR